MYEEEEELSPTIPTDLPVDKGGIQILFPDGSVTEHDLATGQWVVTNVAGRRRRRRASAVATVLVEAAATAVLVAAAKAKAKAAEGKKKKKKKKTEAEVAAAAAAVKEEEEAGAAALSAALAAALSEGQKEGQKEGQEGGQEGGDGRQEGQGGGEGTGSLDVNEKMDNVASHWNTDSTTGVEKTVRGDGVSIIWDREKGIRATTHAEGTLMGYLEALIVVV